MNQTPSLSERLQLLADCSDDLAFVFFDPNGTITHFSHGAEIIFARSAAETVGQPASELFVPEDVDRGMDVIEREVALRNKVSMDDRWQKRKDGSRFWATGAMVPISENGQHVGFGKMLRNRTDLKVQIETLRNGVDELQALVQARDVFLSTLSHELRSPLAPVSNAVAILRATAPGSTQHTFALGVIDRQMAMLQRLVDDLLDLTRAGTGKFDLRLSVHPVQKILEAATQSVQSLMDEKGHNMRLVVPAEPIRVRCDFERMEQVFVNLLTNAAKYTPPGGRVTASVMIEGTEVAVRFEDNGIGIPHDMLPRIFELFTQVESARTHSRGGLGIGLALVKNLVTLQGGMVQVRSDGSGLGSEFTVRMPLAPNDGPPRAD
jgi:PAS domain S-box-containing protein